VIYLSVAALLRAMRTTYGTTMLHNHWPPMPLLTRWLQRADRVDGNYGQFLVEQTNPLDDAGMVVAVTASLASDDASYIIGQTIYPDGGRLVLNYTIPVA
jgi:hypothetical protein